MANYSELHQTINDNIKPNGNQQITGQVLQNVLNAIVDSLAEGYLFAGVATADGNPGSLDQNAWWLAGPGTYANYGNITVAEGKLAALMWSGEWSSSTVDVGGVIKAGTGIKLDESGAIAIDLVAGDFISIEGNKISCTLDANPFYFTDALPETPVPGTENKVYVVPNSEGTGYDLYQWDAETSAFNKVGSISFTFDPSDFVKKNEVNEAEGPTTLSGDMAYQLGLRNRTSQRVGIDFDNGAGDSINQMVVKSKAGNPATDSYIQMLLNGGDNVLTFDSDGLHVGDSSQSQRVLPTILLISNADHDFFIGPDVNGQPRTFTYPGLYNLLASIYPHKYKIRVVGETNIFDAEVFFIYKSATSDAYIIIYGKGKFVISASVSSDDTLKINPVYAYARRILAKTYGISSWYNASGTSVELYNDLRSFIGGEYNSEGLLGFLCDSNHTYAITDINTASGNVLLVSFQNVNHLKTMTLEIKPTGEFIATAWPYTVVLDAMTYCPIARKWTGVYQGMSDSGLLNQIKSAIATGSTIYLKDTSGMYLVDYFAQDTELYITYKVPIGPWGYGIMHINFNLNTGAFSMLPRGGTVVLYGNEFMAGDIALWTTVTSTRKMAASNLYTVFSEAMKFNCTIVLCNQALDSAMASFTVCDIGKPGTTINLSMLSQATAVSIYRRQLN